MIDAILSCYDKASQMKNIPEHPHHSDVFCRRCFLSVGQINYHGKTYQR